MTVAGSMGHLKGLTPAQALLGNLHCSCGRAVELVDDGSGAPATYQCASLRQHEHPIASEVALERGKVDAERLEEIWGLEEDADPEHERELIAEEGVVMADFDQALPPGADSPSIHITEEPSADPS